MNYEINQENQNKLLNIYVCKYMNEYNVYTCK